MQLVNLTLRLGGSLLHTVPKADVTPAEILILKHIHGADAVVDIRPTKVDKARRQDAEWSRLAQTYDASSSLQSPDAGNDSKAPLMQTLFPGAMRKLPTTLKEIGLGHLAAPGAAAAAPAPEPEPAPVDEQEGPFQVDEDGNPVFDDNGDPVPLKPGEAPGNLLGAE